MESNQASRSASGLQEIRKKEIFKKTSELFKMPVSQEKKKKNWGIVLDEG